MCPTCFGRTHKPSQRSVNSTVKENIIVKASLGLTHDCNFSCRYCYAGEKSRKDMSIDTAKKIVDYVMEITPDGRKIELGFFGGEPLLRIDLIWKIIDYIRKKEQMTGKVVSLDVTTNGTLLTQDILGLFKEKRVNLCVSIDGRAQVHNMNRRYRDGRESYEDVVRGLKLAIKQLDSVQVNAVYGPDTIDFLPDSASFLNQLGVPVIHLNPNISANWDENTISKLRGVYMQIANQYIQSYKQGHEIAINLIDSKIIVFLSGGYKVTDKCGMGETEWGFAPSGNIYPCERLIGDDTDTTFCLGNIHTGLNLNRRCTLLKHRGNRNKECGTCAFQIYCMNWCGCTNYYMSGHTDLTGPMMCESEKAAIQAAYQVLFSLKENELFLDHFIKYLHERRPSYTTHINYEELNEDSCV